MSDTAAATAFVLALEDAETPSMVRIIVEMDTIAFADLVYSRILDGCDRLALNVMPPKNE
jgi:hypothetical protein